MHEILHGTKADFDLIMAHPKVSYVMKSDDLTHRSVNKLLHNFGVYRIERRDRRPLTTILIGKCC